MYHESQPLEERPLIMEFFSNKLPLQPLLNCHLWFHIYISSWLFGTTHFFHSLAVFVFTSFVIKYCIMHQSWSVVSFGYIFLHTFHYENSWIVHFFTIWLFWLYTYVTVIILCIVTNNFIRCKFVVTLIQLNLFLFLNSVWFVMQTTDQGSIFGNQPGKFVSFIVTAGSLVALVIMKGWQCQWSSEFKL